MFFQEKKRKKNATCRINGHCSVLMSLQVDIFRGSGGLTTITQSHTSITLIIDTKQRTRNTNKWLTHIRHTRTYLPLVAKTHPPNQPIRRVFPPPKINFEKRSPKPCLQSATPTAQFRARNRRHERDTRLYKRAPRLFPSPLSFQKLDFYFYSFL